MTMQHHGISVGRGVWSPHDGRRTYVQGEEEREGNMQGLWKGGGGGVAGLPPNDTSQKSTGKELDMDGHGYGGGEGGNPQTYRREFPKGGAKACPAEGCPWRAGTRTEMLA